MAESKLRSQLSISESSESLCSRGQELSVLLVDDVAFGQPEDGPLRRATMCIRSSFGSVSLLIEPRMDPRSACSGAFLVWDNPRRSERVLRREGVLAITWVTSATLLDPAMLWGPPPTDNLGVGFVDGAGGYHFVLGDLVLATWSEASGRQAP